MQILIDKRLIWSLALGTLFIHLLTNILGGYGFFRDELYYLACADHLDIGYVDHPPLSIWVLAAIRSILGTSLFAIRLLPAVLHSAIVYATVILTSRFGGKNSGQLLSGICAMTAPILLGMTGFYNMNPFDILLWTIAFILLFDLLADPKPTGWIMLGLVLGLGLLNKISMLWLEFGIFVALVTTGQRKQLLTPWPWIAGSIAFLIFAPFVIWNVTHDFAHLEFARRAAELKYQSQNPATFLTGLVMISNPIALPVWLTGLWLLIRRQEWRFFGITILSVLAILLINIHSKSEYFSPALPLLFAAGAAQIETWSARKMRWVNVAYPMIVGSFGILLIPLTLDILPIHTFERYQSTLGLARPSNEGHQMGQLPQHFADRFGWSEMADSVATVYRTLSPEEQKSCAILGSNYGEAAAIDFYGRDLGLPRALSQHNSYYYWGIREWKDPIVVLVIRHDAEDLRSVFEDVRAGTTTFAPHAMPYENGQTIWICRNFKVRFSDAWQLGKTFI